MRWRSRATRSSRSALAVGFNVGDFATARYNPNGSLDTSFSGDGMQTTDFGGDDLANDVAIQANGKIVAAGIATGGATGNDFALTRYNANGSLDTSFAGGGRKRTNFGGSDSANGVALQGDARSSRSEPVTGISRWPAIWGVDQGAG